MAALSAEDRAKARAFWCRNNTQDIAATKAQILQAINEEDDFLEDNAASILNGMSVPLRALLSNRQKFLILALIINQKLEDIGGA